MENQETSSLGINVLTIQNDKKLLRKDIVSLIVAQVDYAFSNNNLDNLYHPAPPEVWKKFFERQNQIEERINLESKFQKGRPLKHLSRLGS